MKKLITVCAVVMLIAGLAQATIGPITFATDSDYDNNSPQALGLFRDFRGGDKFSRGNAIVTPAYTALNHTTGTGGGTGAPQPSPCTTRRPRVQP